MAKYNVKKSRSVPLKHHAVFKCCNFAPWSQRNRSR
nr:MAG TPA: hypothetical protein [Caudoviricetes sp.]